MTSFAAVPLLVALVLLMGPRAARSQSTFSVSWSSMDTDSDPTHPEADYIGEEVGDGAKAFTGGACKCDLTPGGCDNFCCCDEDCSEEQVESFRDSAFGCATKNFSRAGGAACLDNSLLTNVNFVEKTVVGDKVCVTTAQNPSLGKFLAAPVEAESAAEFDGIYEFITAAYPTFETTTPEWLTPTEAGTEETDKYLPGDIVLSTPTGTGKRRAWKVPATDFTGACSTNGAGAKFLVDRLPGDECQLRVPSGGSLAATCVGAGAVQTWTTGATIAQTPAGTQVFSVAIASVNGVPTSAPPAPVVNGSVSNATSSGPVVTSFTGGECQNALVGLIYEVAHNGEQINAIFAHIFTKTIPGSSTGFMQKWGVKFVDQSAFVVANDPTSIRFRSGNPGYLVGKPLLVGNLLTNPSDSAEKAIEQSRQGLIVTCDGGNGTASAIPPSAEFGQDSVASCLIPLSSVNSGSVSGTCNALRAASTSGLTVSGPTTWTHVGKFGDADYAREADWTEVITTPPAPPGSSGSSDSVDICVDVVVEAQFELLVTRVGATHTSQWTVIAARRKFVQRNVDVSDLTSGNLEIRFVVSFVETRPADLVERIPNPPPLLPRLPADTFYPFSTNTGDDADA